MKRMLLGLFLLGGLLLAGDLNWERDPKSALAKAEKENRPVMVMVESDHCRWCKKMQYKTLADDEVSRRLEKFVLVKIDRDGSDAKELPFVKYVPTIYFMTPQKKILERITGYFSVSDFGSWLDDVNRQLK